MNHRKEIYVFMSRISTSVHENRPDPKQIKIPDDGQLSKNGTVIKSTKTAEEVDYSIAEIVEKINNAGFISKFSCSGLKKDHPLIDVKPDGAYISFLYQDNEAKALNLIEKAAAILDMTVEYCKMSRSSALVVRIDKDKAGHSLSERIRIAAKNVNSRIGEDLRGSFGACTEDLEAVTRKNGGLIYDTDEKIETVWKKFGNMLLSLNCRCAG